MSLAGRPARAPAPAAAPRAVDRCGGVALAVGVSLDGVAARRATCRRRPVASLLACRRRCCSGSARRRRTRTAKPPAYQSVLLATGLPLLFAGLFTARSLAGDLDPPPAWAFTGRRGRDGGARAVAGAGAQQRDLAAARRDPRRRGADRGLGGDLRLDLRGALPLAAGGLRRRRWCSARSRCASRPAATPRC